MEDDEISDQESVSFFKNFFCISIHTFKVINPLFFQSHLEEHGPFKSFTKLVEHNAHLAVFLNYVISNSDPSALVCKLKIFSPLPEKN